TAPTIRCSTRPPARSRSRRRTTGSSSTPPRCLRASCSPTRTCSITATKASPSRASRSSASSTIRRRAPDHTTRATCSRGLPLTPAGPQGGANPERRGPPPPRGKGSPMPPAALLDGVIEPLYARHTADSDAASAARREYEERRGKVHQEDDLWEPWSAAFV